MEFPPAAHVFIQTKVITTASGVRKRVKVKNDSASIIRANAPTAATRPDAANGKLACEVQEKTTKTAKMTAGAEAANHRLANTTTTKKDEDIGAHEMFNDAAVGKDPKVGALEDVNEKKEEVEEGWVTVDADEDGMED
ncbi:hypothetical protein MBLNU230_g1898t1 [Neophaeotheca triangularis]